MAYFRGTTSPLAKESSWTSMTALRERHDSVQGEFFADKAGKFFVEQSMNGTNWDVVEEITVEASKAKSFNVNLVLPYWRVKFSNTGAEAQTALRVFASTQASGDS